jgi:hypothetical protein
MQTRHGALFNPNLGFLGPSIWRPFSRTRYVAIFIQYTIATAAVNITKPVSLARRKHTLLNTQKYQKCKNGFDHVFNLPDSRASCSLLREVHKTGIERYRPRGTIAGSVNI